jgi:threonyl-tRNA synthetase
MLVVGDKEQTAGTVAVRGHFDGNMGTMPIDEFLTRLEREVKEKTIRHISTATAGMDDSDAKFSE